MATEMNETMNDKLRETQFTYINTLTDKFYEFMGTVYIEYNKIPKPETPLETPLETLLDTKLEITPPPIKQIKEIKEIKEIKQKSFSEYFLFKLFYNYGIKRRMLNEHIAILYYSKTNKGYKKNEPITMLCRHMMLDTHNMRIVSLGIPKAVNLDDFCSKYEIDKENKESNYVDICEDRNEDGTQKRIEKFRIYKFIEGTMMTYNPSLKKYNITTLTSTDNLEDTEGIEGIDGVDGIGIGIGNGIDSDSNKKSIENAELLNASIEIKFNQQFMVSTRKVVGTGRFNSLKTFYELFEENNAVSMTNLDNIPEHIMDDKVLVFNIEHPENTILSLHTRKINTLCAVFQFKDDLLCKTQYDLINDLNSDLVVSMKANETNETNETNELEKQIIHRFKQLGTNMISQIQVATFKKQVQEFGVNLHLPEVIRLYEKLSIDGEGISVSNYPIDELNIKQIEDIVSNKPKTFQGYIIYGLNGERTKITNQKYKDLIALKGSKPIVIEQWNTKNLFLLYWRLVKENTIENFIKEFDNVGNNFMYTKLFNWFLTLVHGYGIGLFKVYHYAFVKKTFVKTDIPYSMKPMCGDLHKLYLSNKCPISQTMVIAYLFKQNASQIFWRLFLDKKA